MDKILEIMQLAYQINIENEKSTVNVFYNGGIGILNVEYYKDGMEGESETFDIRVDKKNQYNLLSVDTDDDTGEITLGAEYDKLDDMISFLISKLENQE